MRAVVVALCAIGAGAKKLAWLSDVHSDPYYATPDQQCKGKDTAANPLGTVGCDSPFELFRQTVGEAAAHNPDAVLFTGDFTRHNQDSLLNPEQNVSNIISDTTQILADGFPELQKRDLISLGALGNDDSPKNYELDITTNQLSNGWLSEVGGRFAEDGVYSGGELREFAYGGAIATDLGPIRILTINTVIYSVKHTPKTDAVDPFGQFRWLRAELERAANEKRMVWIVGHIPPGIESYGYSELWMPEYVQSYLDIVQDARLGSTISVQLFGHVHADEFRLLPNPARGTGPILLSGAISPIYNNNPSFRIVEVDDKTGKFLNYEVYYAKLEDGATTLDWELAYSAKSEYKTGKRFDMKSYEHLFAALERGDGSAWNSYSKWYKAGMANDLEKCVAQADDAACKKDYLCAVTVQTQKQYDECSGTKPSKPASLVEKVRSKIAAAEEPVYKEYQRKHDQYLKLRFGRAYARMQTEQIETESLTWFI